MFDSLVGHFWRLMAEDQAILYDGSVDELFYLREDLLDDL